MDAFEIDLLSAARRASGKLYHEFLRVPALSAGLYALAASEPDPQTPHQEDEVYVVVKGRAKLRVGEEERPMAPGSIAYVPRGVEHRFFDVEEDLEVLVLFAPAETG